MHSFHKRHDFLYLVMIISSSKHYVLLVLQFILFFFFFFFFYCINRFCATCFLHHCILQLAVEMKQGISQLELLFQEFSREDRLKQKRKQVRKLKKRRKKERKNAAAATGSQLDDDEVCTYFVS